MPVFDRYADTREFVRQRSSNYPGIKQKDFFFSSFFGFDKCSINSAVYCVVIKFHCLVNMRVVFVEEA